MMVGGGSSQWVTIEIIIVAVEGVPVDGIFFFDHLISIKIVYLMISFVFYHYTCIFNHRL